MSLVRSERVEGGSIALLTIDAGAGNVITSSVAKDLLARLVAARSETSLKAVVLGATGADFSFGASVEEHLPDTVRAMLRWIHDLLRSLLGFPIPVVAAVAGRCLGGGFEVALSCTRIFASVGATFGCPEIKLGVLAPAASVLLPMRTSLARAEDLLLTGRTLSAAQAADVGLVDESVPAGLAPADRALDWVREYLLPLSGTAIRTAYRAVRQPFAEEAADRIARLEEFYVEEIVPSADAGEGLRAFLEKRAPKWRDG